MSEEKIPIERSATTENKHTLWCSYNEQRRHYYACLWLCDAYKAGRITPDDVQNDCAIAMQKGQCNAAKMRQEEITAGNALYFKSGTRVDEQPITINKDSYKRGWEQVGAALGKKSSMPSRPNIAPLPRVKLSPIQEKKAINNSVSDAVVMPKEVSLASVITEAVKAEMPKAEKIAAIKKRVVELAKEGKNDAARRLLDVAKRLQQEMVNESA